VREFFDEIEEMIRKLMENTKYS